MIFWIIDFSIVVSYNNSLVLRKPDGFNCQLAYPYDFSKNKFARQTATSCGSSLGRQARI